MALPDRRVFAIGDIHGRDDLLGPLIEGLLEVAAGDSRQPLFIFLGDFVDRGPSSREVIERLVGLRERGVSARFLCGNHEEAMLRFLDDLERGLAWPGYGGIATMASYGVSAPVEGGDLESWKAIRARLAAAIPASHLHFLRTLEDTVELGDYLFVHAGVRPGVALRDQKPKDLRWIREPFLSDPAPLERVVVHGHTPGSAPYSDHRRIGIDTWAYRYGSLTALDLMASGVRFWQATQAQAGVEFHEFEAMQERPADLN